MEPFIHLLVVCIVIADILLLALTRTRSSLFVLALQGISLSVLAIVLEHDRTISLREGLVFFNLLLRGLMFPWLLLRASQESKITRDSQSSVSPAMTMLLGVGIILYCIWLSTRMGFTQHTSSSFILPSALSTVAIGLLLLMTRRNVLSQVMGYIVLENGICLLGIGLRIHEPFLVELGVLLDVFVGLFIMGIVIHHIRQEFDEIDVDQLAQLKE